VEITVKLSRTNEIKKIEIEKGSNVEQILRKINLKPDTVVVMSGDKPVPIDDKITDKQELTIIQVSSGG
jgi:sulfur carrier protein ThiS